MKSAPYSEVAMPWANLCSVILASLPHVDLGGAEGNENQLMGDSQVIVKLLMTDRDEGRSDSTEFEAIALSLFM